MEPETPNTPDTTTPPAPEGEPTSSPMLGSDGTPIDPVRQQVLIEKLRGIEKDGRARDLAQQAAIRALVSSRPLTDSERATIDAATPAADAAPMYEQTIRDVGRLLGLTDEAITAPGGADALVSATKAVRMAGALTSALVEAGVADLALARSAVNLEGVDPASANLPADLRELVGHFLIDHPSMRKAASASVSGASHMTGAAGGPQFVTRDQMAFMTASQIHDARKAGLVENFSRK